MFHSNSHTGFEDLTLKPSRICHPNHNARGIFFPYPGDTINERWRNLLHIIHGRISIFDEIDNCAMPSVDHYCKELFKDMTKGKEGKGLISIKNRDGRKQCLTHKEEVLMSEHRSLWRTGRARSIDKNGQVIDFHLVQPLLIETKIFCIEVFTQSQQIIEAHQ